MFPSVWETISSASINPALQVMTCGSGLAPCLSICYLSENLLRQGVKILKTWNTVEIGGLDPQNLASWLYFNTQMISTFPPAVLLGCGSPCWIWACQPTQREDIALARSRVHGQRKKLCGSHSEEAKIRPTEKEEKEVGLGNK